MELAVGKYDQDSGGSIVWVAHILKAEHTLAERHGDFSENVCNLSGHYNGTKPADCQLCSPLAMRGDLSVSSVKL